MDANERKQILALLEDSRAALLAAVDGVSDERARRIPAPGRWSILGCVEHLAFSEDYFFAQILNATPSDPPLINLEREAKMLARGADRTRKMESPSEGHPSGAFPTLAAALNHFLESRNRSIRIRPRQPGRSAREDHLAPNPETGQLSRNAAQHGPPRPTPRQADRRNQG